MTGSTDLGAVARMLGVAVLLAAGSGCATLSNVAGNGYDRNMAAAELALRGDDASSAVQAYRRAAEAAPASTLPWLKIAETEAGLGDWPQALAASQEVLNRDPNNIIARGYYLDGSLQLALDALGYLPDDKLGKEGPLHELASNVLAKLVQTLGDEAIPVVTRQRWEAAAESRLRRRGLRATPLRRNHNTNPNPSQEQKVPEKATADPFDVLGGG